MPAQATQKPATNGAAKTSFLAALAIFFSTSVALGAEPAQLGLEDVTVQPANVTIVAKQPAQPTVSHSAMELSGLEKQGIQDTVRSQLKALATGNAEMAFANLAPRIQSYFAEPGAFLTSVAHDAPPITETRSFTFLGTEGERSAALQQVLITDQDGRSWLAKFEVEQQPAGDWRVKGCVVENVPGQQA